MGQHALHGYARRIIAWKYSVDIHRIQQHIGKTNTHNNKPIRDTITPKSRLRGVIYAMHVSLSRGGPIHYPLLSWSRRLNSFFTANHMSPVCPIPSLVSRSIMSV
ncbi:Uncharacterized protein HZ326_18965 [Fusarium oxysporum f. sp. albedinis]|nr:Uncharacterized protein HZ326_18965 [Fusarium oxysporum f. sp. albedinis]